MYSFVDRTHFKNYIRKICSEIGLEKEHFENNYSYIFLNIFDFSKNHAEFLAYLKCDLCKQITYEFRKLSNGDFQYLIYSLEKEYSLLNKELLEISHQLNQKLIQNSLQNQSPNEKYGIDISKYRIFLRCAEEQNKFIIVYKSLKKTSSDFVNLIEKIENRIGLYFLYNQSKELIYIGKSINLGNRILNSIRARGACFVSVAFTKTKADMHVYEPYYILKKKPALNTEFQEFDELTMNLPDLEFSDFISIYNE